MDRMTQDLEGARHEARLIVLGQADPGRARGACAVPVPACARRKCSRQRGLGTTGGDGRGLPARRLPSPAATDAAGAGAAAAGDPVPLQPPAFADDPRRRAHRVASARVPPRPWPRGRFRHPDRAGPEPAPGARGLAGQPLPVGRADPARHAQPARRRAAGFAAGRSRSGSCSAPPSSPACANSWARCYDMAYAYYIRSAEALREARRARPDLATFMALQLSQTLNTERLARTAATLGPAVLPLRDPAHGRL